MVPDLSSGNHLSSLAVNSAVATGIPASLWTYASLPDFMGVIGNIDFIIPVIFSRKSMITCVIWYIHDCVYCIVIPVI